MQVSIWATILRSMSLEATTLLGVITSISSMNKIHGAELCGGTGSTSQRTARSSGDTFPLRWEEDLFFFNFHHFQTNRKGKRAARVWSSFGTLLAFPGPNVSLSALKTGRTDHSQVEELPKLLLGLPGQSGHHLWSRNLQHGQLQLLTHHTEGTFQNMPHCVANLTSWRRPAPGGGPPPLGRGPQQPPGKSSGVGGAERRWRGEAAATL